MKRYHPHTLSTNEWNISSLARFYQLNYTQRSNAWTAEYHTNHEMTEINEKGIAFQLFSHARKAIRMDLAKFVSNKHIFCVFVCVTTGITQPKMPHLFITITIYLPAPKKFSLFFCARFVFVSLFPPHFHAFSFLFPYRSECFHSICSWFVICLIYLGGGGIGLILDFVPCRFCFVGERRYRFFCC